MDRQVLAVNGPKIREIRKTDFPPIKQETLATEMKSNAPYLSLIENGKQTGMTLETFGYLLQALHIPLDRAHELLQFMDTNQDKTQTA